MCNSASISARPTSDSSWEVRWSALLGGLLLITVAAAPTIQRFGQDFGRHAVTSGGPSEPLYSLSLRPSHDGLFVAAVVDTQEPSDAERGSEWIVRLTDETGVPVTDARIEVDVWMPESGERSRLQPRSGSHRGDGEYPITALDFSRPGWWNVALHIVAGAGTDSVAFNLVLPSKSNPGRGAFP